MNLTHGTRIRTEGTSYSFARTAETFVYGLQESVRNDWFQIKEAMDCRFGHKAMKESYTTEANCVRREILNLSEILDRLSMIYTAELIQITYKKEASIHFWTTAVKTKISV